MHFIAPHPPHPFRFIAASLACLAGASTLAAAVSLPAVLSDGAVLQRDAAVPIWGWAEAGEDVAVTFRGETYTTSASEDGRWRIELTPQPAGGPYTLEVAGETMITLRDVYLGDVWLCSGQSNMELPVERVKERYATEIASSANPQIRYFGVQQVADFEAPRDDVQSEGWLTASPETVLRFNAVGYFFARALQAEVGVPIGIVNASVGGTPIEAWMSEEALTAFPRELAEAHRWRDDALRREAQDRNEQILADWDREAAEQDRGLNGPTPWFALDLDVEGWPTLQVPGFWDEQGLEPMHGVVWFRREFTVPESMVGQPAMAYLGTIVDADETYLNGQRIGNTTYQYPPRRYEIPAGLLRAGRNVLTIRAFAHQNRGEFTPDKPFEITTGESTIDLHGPWQYQVGARLEPREALTFVNWNPLGLHNGMIAPLTPFPVKGVLWYQGESNVDEASMYEARLRALVMDWRRQRQDADLPFIWVQLANFLQPDTAPSESEWARLRDAQRRALDLPATGMAVAIDVGEWNDAHSLNKSAVGERLALEARRVAYGEDDLVSAGPLLRSAQREGSKVRLRFDHVGSGLIARGGYAPRHFAVSGPDGRFVKAEARIEGDSVVVWSPQVASPTHVRYAWADTPLGANLYNREGLPASPFEVNVD
ncbi:MAG: sialate O-acetylesterase [Verrucomicrobiota bacterium JB022]|nr:sialate O-acetylesterase [Verrucomicrobiota bacterium JB022]